MPAAKKVASAPAKRAAPAVKRAPAKLPIAPAVPAPKAAVAAKLEPPRKIKVLRDTFRMPQNEYDALAALKQRAAGAGHPARKSEVLRAGLKALAAMGDIAFLAALAAVPPTKPARTRKS